MIFDTDVLIAYEKKNPKAARLIEAADEHLISAQTYMEFLQGAQSINQVLTIKDFLNFQGFRILPLSENIGQRACVYIEEYAVSSGIRAGDAIIAATAVEHNLPLATGNHKHFKAIRELKLHLFSA